MATLLYKGYDQEGHRISGSKGFSSQEQMKAWLDKQAITNYEIFESKTQYKNRLYALASPKELSIFCKQMSVLYYSHITLMEGLLILAEQTENKQIKQALSEIHGFMEQGHTFAEAMGMYDHIFTTYLLNMITIGETSGTLDAVFSRMSDYFDKEGKIRKKLKSAVTYPAILTVLMAAIVLLLIVKILPMFSDILDSMGGEMPAATKVILNASAFLTAYAPVILLILVVLVVAYLVYIRTEKGALWYDKAKFKIPALRFVNSRVITSRFSRSLSILLRSGVQLLNALEDVTVLMDNKFLEGKFREAISRVKNGEELSKILEEIGIFPVLFLKMLIVGQKTGNLDEMLEKSASVFDDEVDDAIERITVMLEPILIIVLSVIVGVILLSVMLPMITIMNSIG